MTAYILCYETFALFETILISYMFNSEESKEKAVMVGIDNSRVISFEGIIIEPELTISKVEFQENDLLVIPGGNYKKIPSNEYLEQLLRTIFEKKYKIAAICSGVDYLKEMGYLEEYKTILSDNDCIVKDRNLITGKPNAFVEFAIEISNSFNILGDEEGYLETVRFFKNQQL